MRRLSILVSVFAGAVLVGGTIAAQDEGRGEDAPRIIPPRACRVEPRSAEELYQVLGLLADVATPGPSRAQYPPPPWEPADAETTVAVGDTVRELIGCLNAGDLRRTAALLTDAGAQRLLGVGAPDPVVLEQRRGALAATPTALEEDVRTRLIAVTDVSVLDDGRAAAFIVVNDPLNPPRGPQTLLLILARQGDRWLIDDFIGFTIARPEPRGGTPTAGGDELAVTPTP